MYTILFSLSFLTVDELTAERHLIVGTAKLNQIKRFFFFKISFLIALEPVLELALVDQAGLPLPPERWD